MDTEEQYDKLLRYCYMKLRDRDLAEDVTQEAFIRFLESRTYRESGKAMAYLYTIAGNLCTDRFRRRRETLLEDLPPGTQEALLTAESADERVLDRLSVESALDRLDAGSRELLTLRYVCELPVNAIAEMAGISRFALRRRISAALAKLRREMDRT